MPVSRKHLATLAAGLVLVAGMAGLAHAQSSLGLGTAEPGAAPSPFLARHFPWFQHLLTLINTEQQGFYRALTGALKEMRTNSWALTGLVGLSFAYGVFHAAGPGHGKAVISSYMIANETQLKRGVAISFISSFVQGAVAVLLTGAGFLVLHGTAVTMTDAARFLEIVSFAAITGFGLWLLWRKLGPATRRTDSLMATAGGPAVSLHHDHHHDHHHHAHHGHDHGHDHSHAHAHAHSHGPGEVCETCGHAHMPDPATLKGDSFSWRDGWTAIMAVGLRPCSGALIVLTFAFLNGLYLGGVLSVVAMSLGTAITVSLLATLAVTAKGWAMKLGGEGAAALRIGSLIEIAGAVAVTLFGFTLLMASLQA